MTTATMAKKVPSRQSRAQLSDAKVADFEGELWISGVKDSCSERAYHSGILALANGMPVKEIVDCLLRNRSEFFDPRLASRRRNKVLRGGM